MSPAILVIAIGSVLLCLYGAGVYASCLRDGESPKSAAIQASFWWAAFSISHLFGYLALTLR